MDDVDVYDRASVYLEQDADGGEVVVYRASSLGYCKGALYRARIGMTGSAPPDVMQERFDEGHAWEARVIAAGLGVDWTLLEGRKLSQYGTVVVDEATGSEQVETEIRFGKDPVKVIRCHPDAVAVHGSRFVDEDAGSAERRVVEAKFLGPDLYYQITGEGLTDAYAVQLSIEMHSTGLPALYIVGLKERATDGTVSLGDVSVLEFDKPPMWLGEIKMRVLEVEGYVARDEKPPCPVPFDYPCAYWADHDGGEGKQAIEDDEMQKLVAAYEIAMEDKEFTDEAVKLLKGQVLERMRELGVKSGGCGGWTVTVVQPERGNVSWALAYKALSKQTGERVEEDEFRGEVGTPYVAMKKGEADD